MSQQGGSSMVSSSIPNSEAKYQKALKQISKLINTNKILKAECEQREHILTTQLSDAAMRCEDLARKYEESQNEKRRMQEFMEELQDTNQDLRKQYQTLEREVGYLNDVLAEQNAELKKLSVFKDEKGISQLFRSYEDRQETYKQEISRLQEHVSQLKTTIDRIEEDLIQETQLRQRYEDQYNIIGLEINKYRELNNYLMDKNQHILGEDKNRTDRGMLGQHQIESVVLELKRQLQMLRNIKYESQDTAEKQYVKNYEILLEQKNSLALELARTKDQLAISEQRIKEMYEVEEKMSTALARSQVLIEENNMLKNRITILESKEIIDSAGFDQDSDLKVFQDKINYMMAKSDPLNSIKNSEDNTHFVQMKSYITDLQAKLHSVLQQKQTIEKKYKNLKLKFNKKAEENIVLEESHKLLKGKLEGYERLAEKLNYELEKSIQAHEDQIVKMVAITNNLVSKKVQESKTASAFIKSQFDLELEKAERAQKSISQQLETLRLENSTLKIKLSDIEQKMRQSSQLLQIHQTKLGDVSARYKELEQENSTLNEKLIKYEHLYHEQKARHETILVQKQAIANKLNIVTQELNERAYSWEEAMRQKEASYESEVKRNRSDVQRFKEEVESLRTENQRLAGQLQKHRVRENNTVSSLKQENQYLQELENSYNQAKQQNHLLETEIISLRHKVGSFDDLKSKFEEIESDMMRKSDELNDEKRLNIRLKKQVQTLQQTSNDLREHNQHLLGQITALKTKLYHPPAMPSSTPKQLETRKTIQRLHEEIALLESTIRDQKRVSARLLNQIQTYKDQNQRLQDMINKNKLRQQSLLDTISATNNQLLTVQDQLFETKSKLSQTAYSSTSLGQELDKANHRIAEITEQLNLAKAKLTKTQSNYNNLIKDLTGTKFYIQETDKMVKRLSSIQRLDWDQQRQKDNLSALVDLLNKLIKNSESLQLSNNSSNLEYSFVPASSFGNIQSNFRSQNSSQDYNKIKFGGSFGNDENTANNIVTNDTFRVYSAYPNSESFSTNVNFSAQSFGRPSQL